ncbi:hypothetical protein KC332_g2067 [Hortaea werneckii]|uniref:Uncharacterized protein n=1 Tax=Hortaea werneckii EXF-2000 TaxID=1157616 RepID=A0A1Z5SWU9_HORWE|nr:hypothetical protein KC358_g11156 [Hortaea werneckii]OTA25259.1 hypothetical protein BTJ68_11446 [Hortaea werneckii EXF-2000]KAI6835352.1 hypothetical protein KC350_g6535 [Hortaea werneckii]KAI6917387.1 hypothetical protein KC348_g11201 [Hortaea werneckii]KAI6939162.1 hypothetical protein KC341_g4374 [Hortaea werneckii]
MFLTGVFGVLLICGLGYYSIATAGSQSSYASAMAKTSWMAGPKRKRRDRTGVSATDPEEERDPPLEPTPVTFPTYQSSHAADWNDSKAPPNFQTLFARILKPADVSREHQDSLNIEIQPQCTSDDLLPLASDGTSYLPSMAPQQAINAASYSDATKVDAATSRKRKDFDERLAELRVDNETAYRTLTRSLRNGVKAPRLAYMRKFWEGLENMGQYWDCSKDAYSEAPPSEEDGEQSAKRQRLESTRNGHREGPNTQNTANPDGDEAHTSEGASSETERKRNAPANAVRDLMSTSSLAESSELRYSGWRTGTGRNMPDTFRADAVRAFVEGTVWPFQCTVSPPRQMPIVHFGKLRLPVRQTAGVYRLPKDRMKARQGCLEGPILALQVRSDTDFVDDDGCPLEGKSRLDLMRELGGMLQIAQERRREGKTEVRPGEGKWWTTVPRWGGGPGGEMEKEEGNADIVQASEDLLEGIKEARGRKKKDYSQGRVRKTPAMLWRELKCGSSTWDPKLDYTAIGKDPESPYDEVFMVSSLNHHICILKLTVHVAYIDYLVSGELPESRPQEEEWYRPKLQRSQWYDLFAMEQRVEALRALWGVMSYLMREPVTAEETSGSSHPQ